MTTTSADIVRVIEGSPRESTALRLGRRERRYEGASLAAYATAAGILGVPCAQHGYFVIEASDGARVTVALAEAHPEHSARPILLATVMDGETIRAGVRLVVPRDGTRSLLGVTGVEYHIAAGGPAGAASNIVTIEGELHAPGRYDATLAAARPSASILRGRADPGAPVPLHQVMARAGMFYMTDGELLSQLLIVVTAEDGSHVVLAASEVGPEFDREPPALLPQDDGTLTLFVPYDLTDARRLERVTTLSLRRG